MLAFRCLYCGRDAISPADDLSGYCVRCWADVPASIERVFGETPPDPWSGRTGGSPTDA
jgi:hypothetical protein